MSQFRLARISLMLAAIGLNAAPAFAQKAPADTVRPELFKLLDPAAVKQLMADKNYAELQSRITQADAFPNKTPYESYVLDRMKIALASTTGNEALLTTSLESAINSGKL